MEQIIIQHSGGTQTPLFSRKHKSAASKAVQKTALLADDLVQLTVVSAEPLPLGIGDRAVIFGKTYKVNEAPELTKDGERAYEYSVKLEGLQYDLIGVHYHLPEDAYGETYYADLKGHLIVLIWNANRIYPGKWVLGECPEETEYKNITNTEKNSLQVLQELCSEYGMEFEITTNGDVNTISIKKAVGVTHPFTLRYGRGKGLYRLQRTNVNNAGITNRVYYYGGTDNLGSNYPHTKLVLPGATRLTSYLEDQESIRKYGLREGEKNYPEIKPERVGEVTALGADEITFSDGTMFDLNAKDSNGTLYLIDGTSAKLKFQDGELAGYEFDVHSYNHTTHTFVINRYKDENGLVFPGADPNGAFRIAVGNKYILTDIQLPAEYKTAAEHKLNEEATKHLPTVSSPQVSYKLVLTESFFVRMYGKQEAEVLHVGDYINIEDEEIGINRAVRITAIERDILRPHSYDITLSDTVTKTIATRVLNDIEAINEIVALNKLADPAKARRRWMATQELLNMVFDPEGDYYSEKIKPLSIETQMLSVGAKSTQFTLLNITLEANYGGNPNTLKITSNNGRLAHYAIDPTGVRYWTMESVTFSGMPSAQAYYIYARCSRTGAGGNFVINTQPIAVEAAADYYMFLVGVLNSAVVETTDNVAARLLSLTYGSSTINGRFIKTGRIESSGGGSCYFDLDNNEIGGILKFRRADGTYHNVADVEEQTQATADYINGTLPGVITDLTQQIDGKIDTWYQDSDPSTAWTTATERAAHVGDMWYNTSTNELKRYSASYSWELITDAKAIAAYQAASQAQDTADGKRRVFVSQPVPPYDRGDLWTNATYGNTYTNELLRCQTAKAQGAAFSIDDWTPATKYTDNSELQDFIENTYNRTVAYIQAQLDGQIEQFFEEYDPLPQTRPYANNMNEPFLSWYNEWVAAGSPPTNLSYIDNHAGDLFYNTSNGKVFRLVVKKKDYGATGAPQPPTAQWVWQQLQDEELAQALVLAQNAYNLADNKRRIFASQPFPPYDVGDLWVQGASGGIMVCTTARSTGNYVASDWSKAANYTDDTALNTFVSTTFASTMADVQNQVDGKVEYWFQTTDPATEWTTEAERRKHLGDIWYNTTAHTSKYYKVNPRWNSATMSADKKFMWADITDADALQALEDAAAAQDTADGKRRVFTATPVPPYDAGDLWTQGTNGDLLVCVTPKPAGGTYSRSDWKNATKYTDDTALNSFISGTFATTVANFENQIDGKIESWFQTTDPAASWSDAEKPKHVGDMWYNPTTKELSRYQVAYTNNNGTFYGWVKIEDATALSAYEAANNAQATADGKMQVFVSQPTTPYDIGDLWLRSYTANGVAKKELWRCVTKRLTGSFNVNDWAEAVYYDNTKTTIDGGIVTSGTVQLAGSDAAIKAGITGNGEADDSVRIWAGASFGNRATAPYRVLQNGKFIATNGDITGKINATSGTIGGFKIASGSIGADNDNTNNADGLALLNEFIRFYSGDKKVFLGTYQSAYTLATCLMQLTNNTSNPYATNRGAIISVTGGQINQALWAKGAIVSDTHAIGYGFAERTPSANNCTAVGDVWTPTPFVVKAKFIYDNSGIGLPTKSSVQNVLGISSSTKFAVRFTLICDAASTKTGYVTGRNTFVTGTGGTHPMDTADYPYRLNNNGGKETGKSNMAAGDIREFLLVYDGTNYYAYTLNWRE